MNRRIISPLLLEVAFLSAACGGGHQQAVRVSHASSVASLPGPATTSTTAVPYSLFGRAIIQPGDRLDRPVVGFGDMQFEPPDPAAVAVIDKETALSTIPAALPPGEPHKSYAKLAVWLRCLTGPWSRIPSKLVPSPRATCGDVKTQDAAGGQSRRVLVWLIAEPSIPGPWGSHGPPIPDETEQERAARLRYNATLRADKFNMIDATTGESYGQYLYGVRPE